MLKLTKIIKKNSSIVESRYEAWLEESAVNVLNRKGNYYCKVLGHWIR